MKIALVGNPNSGKTSIFNQLTGLNQKIGNYPGITVDKKVGWLKNPNGQKATVLDLPGTYSLYPKTADEEIVQQVLADPNNPDHPDLVLVVVDASNLERNLLLYTQVYDLGIPTVLALNMIDVAERKGQQIDSAKLSELLNGTAVVPVVGRTGKGVEDLFQVLNKNQPGKNGKSFIDGEFSEGMEPPDSEQQTKLVERRYKKINQLLRFVLKGNGLTHSMDSRRARLDRLVTHPIWGYLIFLGILMLMFQAIYAWAEWPMNLIDQVFLKASQGLKIGLPAGVLTNLLAEGIVPGLGGVLIFIPQIALLFAFIFILEETGYMARVVFIMDRLMRPLGLNGRSVVPLISGVACAVPAIMSARTIDNWKERLTTIMVTPLMSCSARLPVYTVLISVVIPSQFIGPFNIQGLVLMALYLLGLIAALLLAWVFKMVLSSKQKSFLVMELPNYQLPRWNNMGYSVFEKIKVFVFEAGKVILAISVILWVLAAHGPQERIDRAIAEIELPTTGNQADYQAQVRSTRLANSYIGIAGQAIEPVLRPLGFNWQIGIALITSFAAREVFVGSMATIYSVGENFENDSSLIERMRNEKDPDTGIPVYNLASGLALMVFYAFAMQCMSTLAIVLRETKSWRWPMVQLAYMTILAYLAAWITFEWFS